MFKLLIFCVFTSTPTEQLLGRAANDELSTQERLSIVDELVKSANIQDLVKIAISNEHDAHERWIAIRALGLINSPVAIENLLVLLGDNLSGMRAAAAYALGDTKRTDVSIKVAELLNDPAVIVRAAASKALSQIKDPRTIPHLEKAIEDSSNHYRGTSLWVRKEFVIALGEINDDKALPVLMRCLTDKDPVVVDQALIAIEKIVGFSYRDGRDKQEVITAWQRWWMNQ